MAYVVLIFWILGVAAITHGVSMLSAAGAWLVIGVACLVTAAWPIVAGPRRGGVK